MQGYPPQQGMPQATGFAEGMGANIPLGKVDSNMNSFLSGNMAGGSKEEKEGKQQYKFNFF
jgi:hypothetical protein